MHLNLTHVPMKFVRPSPLQARAPLLSSSHASLGFGVVGAVVGASVGACRGGDVGACVGATVAITGFGCLAAVAITACLAAAEIAAGVRSSQHRFPCALYE